MTRLSRPISAIIFDMDGLMLDTEPISQAMWQRAMAEWGYELPHDLYLQVIGTTEATTKQIFRQAFGVGLPIDAIRIRQRDYYFNHLVSKGITIKPGLVDLLDWLDTTSLQRIVASSTERAWVLRKLQITNLQNRFGQVVGGDEVPHGKPAPDIFLEAAQRLKVAPESCLVLEDSEAGIQAAYAAAMIPIMVPDMKPPSPDIKPLAYRIFPSLDKVQTFLEEYTNKNRKGSSKNQEL